MGQRSLAGYRPGLQELDTIEVNEHQHNWVYSGVRELTGNYVKNCVCVYATHDSIFMFELYRLMRFFERTSGTAKSILDKTWWKHFDGQ